MGRGFFVNFAFSDLREEAAGYKLEKIHSWGDWVHPFDPPQTVLNKTQTGYLYFEFDSGHNSSGDAEYKVVDAEGRQVAYLAFKFKQIYNCCADNDYRTSVQFSCPDNNYALKFGPPIYIPGTYPENWTSISSMPGDHQDIDIVVSYMGNAPVSPDKYCWLTAHNAFANESEGWLYCQQYESFADQLNLGIRAFMLDTWPKDGKIVLAHGGTTGGYAMMKVGSFDTLDSYLATLTNFLQKSPSETVFIFFEDYVKDDASF